MTIKYYSTNKKTPKISFREALLRGQAPDKGLFMPEIIPRIDLDTILSFKNTIYSEIAFAVTSKFLESDIPKDELKKICKNAYTFKVPIEKISENNYILRLDGGPTASFKDFGARMMARLMNYFLKKEDKNLVILVATSGDTGGAVADAFFQQDNIDVIVLFPKKEISNRQRKQMTTLGENIKAIAVNSTFDNCQAMVKKAFADLKLKYLNLSSANSINFGRLLPQTVYYFYAYSRLAMHEGEEIIFSVPCGNFGNLVGGLIAKKMGLSVKRFIVAVNENDEFVKFVETGVYKPIKPSRKCLSNAMNVGHPSNLARLIDLYGGQMDETGTIHKMPDLERIRKDMFTVSISDQETKETIKRVYDQYKTILEPHGAVAWAGVMRYLERNRDNSPIVAFETANPAKFPEELENLGICVEPPQSLKKIDKKPEVDKIEINNDYEEFKKFLIKNISSRFSTTST